MAERSEQRRVAFVVDSLESGGAERQLVLLAAELKGTRWAPRVVRYRPDSFHPLPSGVDDLLLRRRGRVDPIMWAELARAIRTDRVDVVHSWKAFSGVYVGALGLGPRRAPQILHLHTGAAFLRRFPAYAKAYLTSALLADHTVCVAHDAQDWLTAQGVPAERVSFIPNFVERKLADAPPTQSAVRDALLARMGLPKGSEPPIVAIGRLESNKNVAGLVRAVGALRRDGLRTPPVLLVGRVTETEEVARCQSAAAALGVDLHIHGATHEITALLDAAGLVVQASHTEGMPMVVLEAMSRGALVVASATGEVPGLLQDGVTGLLVPQRHNETPDEALAATLRRALTLTPLEQAAMRAAARDDARTRFHPDVVREQWIALYDQLVGARRGPQLLREKPSDALRLLARIRRA